MLFIQTDNHQVNNDNKMQNSDDECECLCDVGSNECLQLNGGCAQNCVNTIATYYCTCRTGYSLASDKHACIGKKSTLWCSVGMFGMICVFVR